MSELKIRAASENEAAEIARLLHEAFAEYRTVLYPPSGVHQESADSVREKMLAGAWLLAEWKGRAVGCVWCEPRETYMYLGRLAVLPAWRGRGIANALMEQVESRARAGGLTRVRLGVRVALTEMRAAYERRGYIFFETRTHKGFDTPTYVILEKNLMRGESEHVRE